MRLKLSYITHNIPPTPGYVVSHSSLSSAFLIVSKLIINANLRELSQSYTNEVTDMHLIAQ